MQWSKLSMELEVHTIGPHTMSVSKTVYGVHKIQYKERTQIVRMKLLEVFRGYAQPKQC